MLPSTLVVQTEPGLATVHRVYRAISNAGETPAEIKHRVFTHAWDVAVDSALSLESEVPGLVFGLGSTYCVQPNRIRIAEYKEGLSMV